MRFLPITPYLIKRGVFSGIQRLYYMLSLEGATSNLVPETRPLRPDPTSATGSRAPTPKSNENAGSTVVRHDTFDRLLLENAKRIHQERPSRARDDVMSRLPFQRRDSNAEFILCQDIQGATLEQSLNELLDNFEELQSMDIQGESPYIYKIKVRIATECLQVKFDLKTVAFLLDYDLKNVGIIHSRFPWALSVLDSLYPQYVRNDDSLGRELHIVTRGDEEPEFRLAKRKGAGTISQFVFIFK